MTCRLTYVLGTASGGTSAVAGVLHHLGVDMGDVSLNPGRHRGYATFEDVGADAFKDRGQQGPVDDFGFDYSGYVASRLSDATSPPSARVPRGCKLSAGILHQNLHTAAARDHTRLVIVHRPLLDCLAAEERRWRRAVEAARPSEREFMETPASRVERTRRAYRCVERCAELVPVAAIVRYYDLLDAPELVAASLAEDLGMNWSPETVERAAAFVDPSRCNVRS